MPSNFPEHDDDLEALEEYLLSPDVPEETMLLSELDGYLTAIAVSPQVIPPEEWLPEIWGGEIPPLALRTDTNWVVGAITGHFDAVRRVLAENPEHLEPIFVDDTDGSLLPEIWAEGFMRGVQLRRQDWEPLFAGEGWQHLAPIGIFAETPDGSPPRFDRRSGGRKFGRTPRRCSRPASLDCSDFGRLRAGKAERRRARGEPPPGSAAMHLVPAGRERNTSAAAAPRRRVQSSVTL